MLDGVDSEDQAPAGWLAPADRPAGAREPLPPAFGLWPRLATHIDTPYDVKVGHSPAKRVARWRPDEIQGGLLGELQITLGPQTYFDAAREFVSDRQVLLLCLCTCWGRSMSQILTLEMGTFQGDRSLGSYEGGRTGRRPCG